MGKKLGGGIGKLNPPKMGAMRSPVGAALSPPSRKRKLTGPIGEFKIGRKSRSKKVKEVFG